MTAEIPSFTAQISGLVASVKKKLGKIMVVECN